MTTCSKCGAEASEDYVFCPRCGSPLGLEKGKTIARAGGHNPESETCFGERDRDYFGMVSFGVFVLIIGIIFAANPNVLSNFRLWVEQMIREERIVRPPQGLIRSATLFFGLIGLSNFSLAGIRLVFEKVGRRVLGDVLSGVALLSFAYLINLYGMRALTWQMVLAIEAILCGILVIVYSALRYVFRKKVH